MTGGAELAGIVPPITRTHPNNNHATGYLTEYMITTLLCCDCGTCFYLSDDTDPDVVICHLHEDEHAPPPQPPVNAVHDLGSAPRRETVAADPHRTRQAGRGR